MRKVLASVMALGCSGCIETHLGKGRPGESIATEDKAISWLPAGVSGGRAGMQHWALIRVIAPPGATKCVSGSFSPLIQGGPEAEGRPDSKREVMLTTDPDSLTVHVRCETPAGDVVRSVDGHRYEKYYKAFKRTSRVNIMPPLLHMDPADPDIEARWETVHADVCAGQIGPQAGFMCQPEIFAALKAADMAQPPP